MLISMNSFEFISKATNAVRTAARWQRDAAKHKYGDNDYRFAATQHAIACGSIQGLAELIDSSPRQVRFAVRTYRRWSRQCPEWWSTARTERAAETITQWIKGWL